MRILGTSVPVLTADIESAIPRNEALTRETVKARFVIPDRGLTIALVGSVALIAGAERALAPLRSVRATFAVDSLADFETHLRASGATILQPASPTPAGRNMLVRDVEGVVFEFVDR
jgi:predicted enzyme related to lactoylglutathione lyase